MGEVWKDLHPDEYDRGYFHIRIRAEDWNPLHCRSSIISHHELPKNLVIGPHTLSPSYRSSYP